jgi:hypothetical protein
LVLRHSIYTVGMINVSVHKEKTNWFSGLFEWDGSCGKITANGGTEPYTDN